MGFYKPTEGNPLRIYVGGERMSVQSCHLLPSAGAPGRGPGTLHANAKANWPTGRSTRPGHQLQISPEHSSLLPAPTTSPPQETEVRGDMVRRTSKASPPAHHLPKVCPLSPLLNPNSDKRPEPPMRLSLRAPRCARRVCLKMTS